MVSVAWPMPITLTAAFLNFFTWSAEHRITAAAPSVTGEQSRMLSGSATFTELRTSFTVIRWGNCARGFLLPFSWFLTATAASCSRVVPYRAMWATAIMAYRPGKVTPCKASQSWSAAVARAYVASPPLMSVIFSTPPTRTTSLIPLATSM